MLRRIERALRTFLLICAAALLTWLPLSWFYEVACWTYLPRHAVVYSSTGAVGLYVWEGRVGGPGEVSIDFEPSDNSWAKKGAWALPWIERVNQFGETEVSLPLWLLAFLCLAWPVTSFLLARRRR